MELRLALALNLGQLYRFMKESTESNNNPLPGCLHFFFFFFRFFLSVFLRTEIMKAFGLRFCSGQAPRRRGLGASVNASGIEVKNWGQFTTLFPPPFSPTTTHSIMCHSKYFLKLGNRSNTGCAMGLPFWGNWANWGKVSVAIVATQSRASVSELRKQLAGLTLWLPRTFPKVSPPTSFRLGLWLMAKDSNWK